jgi:predicted nucleotidyltransferase
MSKPTLAARVATWAARSPEVVGIVLIGSRAREAGDPIAGADGHSDWDFHVITSRPGRFADPAWTTNLEQGEPLIYAIRDGIVGKVKRVTVVFRDEEADFVVVPAAPMRLARLAVACGLHRRSRRLARALGDLAIIARPGYRFLYGGSGWERFYRRVIAEVADPRLEDAEALRRAELFAADYVVMRRTLARGELLAAQRLLHRSLAEINLQLLHEVKLRRGESSFPDARRIERIASTTELAAVTVAAGPTVAALEAALQKCAMTCQNLMRELVGERWHWPDV